jgi:hypothetical protein
MVDSIQSDKATILTHSNYSRTWCKRRHTLFREPIPFLHEQDLTARGSVSRFAVSFAGIFQSSSMTVVYVLWERDSITEAVIPLWHRD